MITAGDGTDNTAFEKFEKFVFFFFFFTIERTILILKISKFKTNFKFGMPRDIWKFRILCIIRVL